VFAGTRAEYEVRFDSVAGTVVVVGPDGVDTLSGIEQLRFSDRTVTALGGGGSPQHLVNVTFPVSPTNPVETSRFMIGSSYSGPVLGLTDEFVFPTPENINIASTLPNAFIRTGAGNDAITVFSGRNVIDAFTGSNFLTGGSGQDTFFLDARGGGSTWDTIVNFGVGDEVTLWGYNAAVSKDGLDKGTWYESDGVDPFKGLTIHAKLDGVNFGASITFAGLGFADRDSLNVSTGSVAGNDYLYITRV
jgi:Ca2+-binding RTX toxin-like protein